jgi:uncharacterized DUF497 family protein
MPVGFEWDQEKAAANHAKHKVSFNDAISIFDDPLSSTIDDPDHSHDEPRYMTIGRTRDGRIVVVYHCDRADAIRIISSREATQRERSAYESGYPRAT